MTLDDFENALIRMTKEELIAFLQNGNLLKIEMKCNWCNYALNFIHNDHYKDNYCWRCSNSACFKDRPRLNIRTNSFFININLPLLTIIKILIRWSKDIPQSITINMLGIDHRTYKKVIQKFLSLVGEFNFRSNKLGGPGKIVQIDETGLNFKIKAHRGRAPQNKTDALCIVEYENRITRAFACVIQDKKSSTIIPLICDNVASNSIIHTDEHKSYSSLNNIGFIHDTVCHKYSFINSETGAHTQAVESFNNCINLDIKKRKGVKTELRQEFLNEFTWKFNNSEDRLQAIMEILKIKY